ncbi:MAG: hypothetical protein IOC82_16990, partial [Aestuariivirga sp.]|uniref:FG-GAP-like repeat-containing protein n=1 Tax=Aestuariivirga sp. TaxID=2650926 RepID=UPI0025C03AF1
MRPWLAAALLCILATSAHAVDDEDAKDPKLPVEGRNGSFSRVIGIDVPGFRGLAPDLRLVYDSSSGIRNLPPAGGELGVGWTLQGVSAIQRVSGTAPPAAGQNKAPSGRGVPAYGAAGFAPDSFLLDSTELVACTEVADPQSTPSCAAGGTHTSRLETYLRIRRDVGASSWEVTGRDGVKSLYTSLEGGSADLTYRWHLASVADRRGNRVDYGWSCDSGHCTIASIRAFSQGTSAPASEVLFFTEARPDRITYGDGRGMRAMTKRITAIQIKSGGAPQSAYRLGYQTSASTGLSRLVAVQKYGSDAVISGGIVTPNAGTALPPYVMSYSENGDADGHPVFDKRLDWSGPGVGAIKPPKDFDSIGFPIDYPTTRTIVGDFDGDGWATDYYMPSLCVGASITGKPDVHDGVPPELPARVCVSKMKTFSTGTPSLISYPLVPFKTAKEPGKLPEPDVVVGVGNFSGDGRSRFARATFSFDEDCGTDKCWRTWSFSGIGFGGQAGGLSKQFNDLKSANGQPGDFDGDGKDDFLLQDGRIALLRDSSVGLVNWGLRDVKDFRTKYRSLIGDANGDGRADVLIHKEKTSTYRLYISTGSGLAAQPSFDLPKGTARQTLGDVNGDGLSDLIYNTGGQIVVAFSNGRSFGPDSGPRSVPSSTFGSAADATALHYTSQKIDLFGFTQYKMGDFNGDGRVDIVGSLNKGSAPGTGVSRSIGTGFESQPSIIPGTRMVTQIADYNGDGADDIARANIPWGVGDPRYTDNYVWLSRFGQADLLTSIQEPLGGRVSVTYGPSAGAPGNRMPFNMQVVKSLTLDDGRGGLSTLGFAYEGGTWSQQERQFLGFQKITTSLPCIAGETACPQQVRTYAQTPACMGRTLQEQVLDGPGGAVLSQNTTSFAEDSQLPFTCLATSTEERTFSGADSRAVSRSFAYDLYGNTTQVTDNGVAGVAGDETLTLASFTPNTGDYVVSCPWRTLVYQGTSTAGPLLSGTSLSYDGGAPGAAPSRCEKTRQDDWVSGSSWITTHGWSYDTAGNRVTETDGAGNTTATVYDGGFKLFPVETQLPGFATDGRLHTLTGWNLACGQPATQTDLNGQVSSFGYDALCRETSRQLPGGYAEYRSYVNFGQPNGQYTKVVYPAPGGQADPRYSAEYIDGFGRGFLTEQTGPTAGAPIRAEKAYNARWGLARSSAPYHFGEPVFSTSYDYDKLNRLTRTTNPDNTSSSISYGLGGTGTAELLATTLTDESGHKQVEATDANGKRVRRTRMKDASPVTTQYRRDGLGRITRVVDPLGNQWSYSYDGLGRRVGVNDPDLGSWSYAYDNASRLTVQTDAKGQRSELSYDALSRVTGKLVRGTGGDETTTNSYDEARTGYFNTGQLTTAQREAGGKRFTQAYDYDVAGRLAQRTDAGVNGQTFTQAFDYWPDGSPKRKRLADGSWTGTYSYDAAGRLFSIGNAYTPSASEPAQYVSSIYYNARGQTTAIAYGGGVATGFSYNDARGFLARVLTQKNGQTALDLSYTRDARGLVTRIDSPDPTRAWAYGYDGLDRLVSADNQNGTAEDRVFAYDDADNLTANSALCGGAGLVYPPAGSQRPHAPVSICGSPVTYDANGNTLSYDPDGPGPLEARAIAYDGENRPVSVTAFGSAASFDYGPDGERAGKTFVGARHFYLGADAEVLFGQADPQGVVTSYLHADV